MTRRFLCLVPLLVTSVLGCGLDASSPGEEERIVRDSNRRLVSADVPDGLVALGISTDWSGRVETQIWECAVGPVQHGAAGCSVDPEYVLIGGGAWADYGTGREGALLTSSHPENDMLQTWVAASKDHLKTQLHTLRVWAVGLRLIGVSRQTLRANMSYTETTSTFVQHPQGTVSVPPGFLLVGGGARVNWSGAGNLLFQSFPTSSTQWTARSKDHGQTSPATITVKAIGLRPTISGFGSLDIAARQASTTFVGTSIGTATGRVEDGWVLGTVGGRATFNGQGRLLFRMSPTTNFNFTVASKDHVFVDGGGTTAFFTQLRLRP